MEETQENTATGRLLWQVTMKWRATVDRAVAPLGLTHATYSLLGSLYDLTHQGRRPSQRELADFAGLDPIYVSKLVKALETAGLVSRAPHLTDPRALRLSLSDQGTTVIREALAVVHALQAELTAPIGGPASATNRELIRILRSLLGTTHSPNEGNETVASTRTPQPAPTLTGQDIAEAQGAVSALLSRVLLGTGSSNTAYVTLRVIALRGPWTDRATLHTYLAGQSQLGLDAGGVAELLDGIAREGAASGLDGAGPVQLTEHGTDLHARLTEHVQAATSQLYAAFEPDELAVAHRILNGITERAGQIPG